MKVCKLCPNEIAERKRFCAECIKKKRQAIDKKNSLKRYRYLRDVITIFEKEYYFLDEKRNSLTRKKPIHAILSECGVDKKTIKEFLKKHEIHN